MHQGAEVEKLREQLQAARKRIATLEENLELEKETQAVRQQRVKGAALGRWCSTH